jgi:hypothetical protein
MEAIKLSSLFWDYDLSDADLERRLAENDIEDPLTVSVYARILLTLKWYEVLRLLSSEQLRSALSERVIGTIHSRSLQERYRFAAERLFPAL